LQVPLAAITIFADPSVNFALQFQPLEGQRDDGGHGGDDEPKAKGSKDDDKPQKTGEVVSLDQFRKK